MVDRSLLEHWCQERAARERIRRSLPPSYRNDPRARMDEIREGYVEAMLQMARPDDADRGRPTRRS